MSQPTKAAKRNLVVKSNAFAESRYMLSINGFRLLAAVITKIDRRKAISHDDPYRVTVEDWIEMFGGHRKTAYRDLAAAARSIRESCITIYESPNGKDGKPVETEINWVQMCRYAPGEGYVEIVWTQFIIPYLSQLESNFLSYELEQMARLRTAYAVRIFELCHANKHRGEVSYTLDDLRRLFRLEKSRTHAVPWKFRQRVIEPAVREINKHTDMRLDFTLNKKGRVITGVRFHWTFPAKVITSNDSENQNEAEKPPIEGEASDLQPEAAPDSVENQPAEDDTPKENIPQGEQGEQGENQKTESLDPVEKPTPAPEPPPVASGQSGELFSEPAKPKDPRGSRLPEDWVLPPEWLKWAIWQAQQKNVGLTEAEIRECADQFADHWRSQVGRHGRKADWKATWRNWIRNELKWRAQRTPTQQKPKTQSRMQYQSEGKESPIMRAARQKGYA